MSEPAVREGRARHPRVVRVLLRTGRLAQFGLYFLYELAVSSAQVAWDVVTPRSRLRPGVVRLELRSRTPAEVTLLSNLICLTPGTLTLAVTDDPPTLYVHGMYAADAEVFRRELQDLEARMLRAWRTEEEER